MVVEIMVVEIMIMRSVNMQSDDTLWWLSGVAPLAPVALHHLDWAESSDKAISNILQEVSFQTNDPLKSIPIVGVACGNNDIADNGK